MGGYRPVYAHEQARARRWSGARLERDDALRACVLERLSWGWSPEQIAGHLAEAAGWTVISYESIYRFIYAQAARHKNHAWRRYLPRAKWKARQAAAQGEQLGLLHRAPPTWRRRGCGGWRSNPLAGGQPLGADAPAVRARPPLSLPQRGTETPSAEISAGSRASTGQAPASLAYAGPWARLPRNTNICSLWSF